MSLYALKQKVARNYFDDINSQRLKIDNDKFLMQRNIDELEENLEMKCSEIYELKKKLYNKENSLAECSLVIFGDSGRYLGLYIYCAEASCYKQISRKSDKHRE